MDAVVEPAPAKVNLSLHVLGRRADGYHDLESAVAFTSFGDTVRVEPADRDEICVDGPFAARIEGPNLIEAARDALRARVPASVPVRIALTKRIPVAAGLGGGSADAAATLRALARLWRFGPAEAVVEELCAIGGTLGADVPMCVLSRALVARGIGERLSPLEGAALERYGVVLVNSLQPLATPEMFARLAAPDNAALPPPEGTDMLGWLRASRNDLEAPAHDALPAIGEVLDALDDALLARMSGSGATCYGLYADTEAARAAATRIAKERPDWLAVATRFEDAA